MLWLKNVSENKKVKNVLLEGYKKERRGAVKKNKRVVPI